MSIGYVASQVGKKIGLDPQVTTERAVIFRWINEACKEMYAQADVAGLLWECVFQCNGNQTIALPQFVKYPRAMREFFSQIPWDQTQMRPRYNYQNWSMIWRNWQMMGSSPIKKTVTNQSVITATVFAVETPPISVTITGPTATATMASETLVMDAVSKSGTVNFLDITSCIKDRPNNYDVSITDIDGNELAVISNNALSSIYQIVDVSLLPWSQVASTQQDHFIEVLYKKALPEFSLDSDEFPAPGYDDAIVNKSMQLYWEDQPGKEERATLFDAKTTRSMARENEEMNRETKDKVGLSPNPHDSLLGKVRQDRPGLFPFPYGSQNNY